MAQTLRSPMQMRNNQMKRKLTFTVFLLIFSIFLSSCGSPVSYTVDKEHEKKMKVIYNMISGLVENDSKLYLSTFEPSYLDNVKKVVDTLVLNILMRKAIMILLIPFSCNTPWDLKQTTEKIFMFPFRSTLLKKNQKMIWGHLSMIIPFLITFPSIT